MSDSYTNPEESSCLKTAPAAMWQLESTDNLMIPASGEKFNFLRVISRPTILFNSSKAFWLPLVWSEFESFLVSLLQ
jgi:hypothetical protein